MSSQFAEIQDLDHVELSRCLFDESNDAFLIVDPELNLILDVNATTQRLTGFRRKQLLGGYLREFLFADDSDSIEEVIRAFQETGVFHSKEGYSLRIASGERLAVNVSVSRIHTGDRVLGLLVIRDVAERKLAEQQLREIVAGTAAVTGDEFFPTLVRQLCQALNVRIAAITEVVGENHDYLQSRAFWCDGAPVDPIRFLLEGSPCHRAIESGSYFCDRGLQDEFPDNEDILRLGAESYFGFAVCDSNGAALGNLCVLDDKPLQDDERLRSLLRVFAVRAGAELERQHAEQKLQENERFLGRITGSTCQMIWVFDLNERRTVFANPSFAKFFGRSLEQIASVDGTFFRTQIHPDDLPIYDAHRDHVRRASDEEHMSRELRVKNSKGEWRWLAATDVVLERSADGSPRQVLGTAIDITERKVAEHAQRESETQLRSVLETATDFILSLDLDGTILYINRTLPEFMREHVIGANVLGFLAPDVQDELRGVIQKVRDTRTAQEYKIQSIGAKGEPAWYLGRIGPVMIDGELVRFTVCAIDVTERHAQNQHVRLAEHTMQTAQDAVFWTRPDGTFMYVNDKAAETLQYSADELCGMTVSEIDPNFPQEAWESYWEKAKDRGPSKFETVHRRKDGSLVKVEISASHIVFEGREIGVSFARDITERKAAESALTESEARWRSLTEHSTDHVLTLDTDLNIQFCNFAAPGLSVDDLIGTPLYSYVKEEQQDEVKNILQSVLATQESADYETEYDGPDGRRVHYESRVAARIVDDQVVGLTVNSRDVTRRQRAEEALRLVVEGTARATGDEFYRSLVKHLARALGLRYVLVAELVGELQDRARTLSVWTVDRHGGGFEWALAGTPCANVVRQSTCIYPSGVQQLFPEDDLLAQMGVESYVGTPLVGATGATIGILAAVDEQPIVEHADTQALLQIFAKRAATELERSRAEDALHKSQEELQRVHERLELAVHGTLDGLWDWDVTNGDVWISPRGMELLEFDPEERTADASLWADIIHPDDIEHVRQATQQHVAEDSPYDIEHRMRTRGGEYRWFRSRGRSVRDDSGAPIRMSGSFQDVTERRQAQQELQIREELYRNAISAANAVVYQIDFATDTYAYIGEGIEELLGYPADEITPALAESTVLQHIMHGACSGLSHVDAAEQFHAGKLHTWSCDKECRAADGRTVWLADSSVLIYDDTGKAIGCLGIASDITERRLAALQVEGSRAEAIRTQNQLIEAIESLTEAFAFYDADDRLVLCNTKYREIYDISSDLLTPGTKFEEHIRKSAYRGQIADAVGREEDWVRERVAQHRNPHGTHLQQLSNGRWLQISERKTRDGGIVGVRTDITERHQKDRLVRLQNEMLEKIAVGTPLPMVFDQLCQHVESFVPGAVCTVMELDEVANCLNVAAAPSLPSEAIEAFNGLQPAAFAGSCGTAAYTGERTIVVDVETDPRWEALRDAARQFGIGACWSIPIKCEAQVVATFAISHTQPRTPELLHDQLLDWAAHIAGIAIERQRAEEALRESEQTYRTLFENSPVGIGIADQTGALLDLNQTMVKMGGYSSKEDVDVKNVAEFYADPADRDRVLQKVMAQGFARAEEVSLKRKDGTSFHALMSIAPVMVKGQRCTLAVVEDISARRELEFRLQRFRDMLDQAAETFFVIDPDTALFIDCNVGATRNLQYSRDELLQLTVSDIQVVAPDVQRPHWPEFVEKIRSQEKALFIDGVHRRKDGSTFPVEVTVSYKEVDRKGYLLAIARDVTERREQEEELRFRKSVLESQTEAAIDGILVVSNEREWLIWNRRFRDIWQYPDELFRNRNSIEAVRWAKDQVLNPEAFVERTEYLYNHSDEVSHDELIMKDGRVIDRHGAPVKSPDGVRYGRVWFYRDITARKKAENMLRGRSRILEQLATGSSLEHVLDTLVHTMESQVPGVLASVLLLEGNRLWYGSAPNLATEYNESIDGLEIGPAVGSCGTAAHHKRRVVVEDTLSDPLWSHFREAAQRFNLRACWSQPIFSHDHDVLGTFALYCHEPRLPSEEELELIDSFAHLAGIAIERKRSEQALRESEQEHRVVTESAHETILTIDEEGTIVFANPAIEQLFGYTIDEIVGRPVTILIPEHLRERHTAALRQLGEGGNVARQHAIEVTGLTKEGELRSIELSFGHHVKDGKRFYTGILRDVSERRRVQQELLKREAELAHVGRLSMLGEAVAEIAHEINQPLYAISNFAKASRIELERGAVASDQLRTRFQRIDDLATSAGNVLTRIRGFLRKQDSERVLVAINEVVHESIQMLDFDARRKQIDVEVTWLTEESTVWADRVQIQQVLVNLLKNAFDAMEQTFTTRVVRIGACRRDDMVEITVEDQGHGFGDTIPETIFDAFHSTKPEGMGLGLAISRSIIEAHGGELWATENADQGATFHVTLPVAESKLGAP